MSFESFEESVEGSRPIELHQFALGTETFNFHTTAEGTITVGSDVYEAEPIVRGPIVRGPEDRNRNFFVRLPRDNIFIQKFVDVIPGQRASYTLRRYQRQEGVTDLVTLFKGFVHSINFEQKTREAQLIIRSIEAASSRIIPRFTYMSRCNNVLYDDQCKVDRTLFRLIASVSAVSGSVLTVPGANAEVDGFYDGGEVFFPDINDARLILKHVGNDLTLLLPFPEDAVGETVHVFAGCDHSIGVCDGTFSNVENFQGFAFVPTRNPFETGVDGA